MITEQKNNYIILGIILILVIGGVYFKNRSVPVVVNETNTTLDSALALDKPASSTDVVKPQPKLTYDQYLQQGINYETKGQLLNAINSYKKASELSPKDYIPYSNAGSAYYSLKNYTEAEDHFLEAIRLSPNNVSVYTKLYEVYYYGLKRDRAQMDTFFSEAMIDTKNDINIVKLYASYLEQINDFESALSIWESLLKFEPDNLLYKIKIEALQTKIKG